MREEKMIAQICTHNPRIISGTIAPQSGSPEPDIRCMVEVKHPPESISVRF
jgi:hypothetical protein